eukprot:4736090-Amphidinium_carterae.1
MSNQSPIKIVQALGERYETTSWCIGRWQQNWKEQLRVCDLPTCPSFVPCARPILGGRAAKGIQTGLVGNS